MRSDKVWYWVWSFRADNESCIAFISTAAVVLTVQTGGRDPSSPTEEHFISPAAVPIRRLSTHSPVSNNPRLAWETTTETEILQSRRLVFSPASTAARTNGHFGLSEMAEEPDKWEVNCTQK